MRHSLSYYLFPGIVLLGILTMGGYLLFVGTRWGQNLDYATFLGHHAIYPGYIGWSSRLMHLVDPITLLVAVIGIAGIATVRRRYLLGLVALIAIFCALVGTISFKKHLPRPDVGGPVLHESENLINESYPSGHTTFAAVILLAFILVSSPRWRPWVASFAGFIITLFGFGVIFVGGHRPADPIGAIVWSTFCMTVVAAVIFQFQKKAGPAAPCLPALSLGLMLCLVATLATLFYPRNVTAFLPLFPMLVILALTAFSTTAWFAWTLSGSDPTLDDSR